MHSKFVNLNLAGRLEKPSPPARWSLAWLRRCAAAGAMVRQGRERRRRCGRPGQRHPHGGRGVHRHQQHPAGQAPTLDGLLRQRQPSGDHLHRGRDPAVWSGCRGDRRAGGARPDPAAVLCCRGVRPGDGEVWLDAEVHVNRADFGLTWNLLGMSSLHNTLTIHAVFTRWSACELS